MDCKDSNRGFAGIVGLASDIGDPPQPLLNSASTGTISDTKNSEDQKVVNKPPGSSTGSKWKSLYVIVGLAIITGIIYMFASMSSGSKSNQAQIANKPATATTPAVPSKPPVKTVTAAQLFNDISPVLSGLKMLNPNQVIIKGKLLIWDQSRNGVSDLQKQISGDLQWQENYGGKTTVMIINSYNDEKVGIYGSDIPAYKKTANISVVVWPDKTPIGRISIVGNDPPQSIRYKTRPSAIYGEINQPIITWIERCQKVP